MAEQDIILIAQIGRGNYGSTTYIYQGNQQATTGYTFDAIVKFKKPNKLLLIGTETSCWEDVIEWYRSKGKKESVSLDEKEPITKKKQRNWRDMEKEICQRGGFSQVKLLILPKGQNDREIYEYFQILKEGLEQVVQRRTGTEIIFDISNGFRSTPLYIMMMVKYLAMIKETEISYSSYYGMYEAKDAKNRTPIVDLSKVTEMTEWINAISEFTSFGSVKKLYRCLEEEKNAQNESIVLQLIETFKSFEYAVNANNSFYLKENIKTIQNLDIENGGLSNQAKELLAYLKNYFTQQFTLKKWGEKYPETSFLMQITDMYLKQERIGQAAVAFQEGMVTYFIERYLKTYILKEILQNKEKEIPPQYLSAFEKRNIVKNGFERLARKKQREKSETKFEKNYFQIKDSIRNVSAHILGMQDIPSVDDMRHWIEDSREELVQDMQRKQGVFRETFINFIENDKRENQKQFFELWGDRTNGKQASRGNSNKKTWQLLELPNYQYKKRVRSYNKNVLSAISEEKMTQLRKECADAVKLTPENSNISFLKSHPFFDRVLCLLIKQEKENVMEDAVKIQYMKKICKEKNKKEWIQSRCQAIPVNLLMRDLMKMTE